MRHPIPATWIVVMDSSVARFYTLHHGENGERRIDEVAPEMKSDLDRHARDIKSDKPGRGFRAAGADQRHAMEPEHDYKKLEKHDFVVEVAQFVKAAQDKHNFERLALVAPDRTLGELRHQLADTAKKAVWREVNKDLVKLNDHELWAHIGPQLQETLTNQA